MKWSRKSVLITGGAGFIGSHLVKSLYEKGAEIIVVDDLSTGKEDKIIPYSHLFIKGDVCEKNIYKELEKRDVDYIFHFAAPSSVILFNEDPEACIYKTIFGFRNIVEFAKKISVNKLIYASSGSVYGNTPLPQSENMQPKPTNLYGVSKLMCEHLARLYSDQIPSVGLRIFAGYGPGEEAKGRIASVITLFLRAILNDERPVIYGDGQQSRDFIYIHDIVEATLKVAETNFVGVINVGSGKSYTFNEVVKLINELLGKNIKPIYVDRPKRYLERTLASRKRQDKIIGIKPMTLEVGLRKYLEEIVLGPP
jgi:UDP-glucose 4-epimerase